METEYVRWPQCLLCGTAHQPYQWKTIRVLHPEGKNGWRAEFDATPPCQEVAKVKTVTEYRLSELPRGPLRSRLMEINGLKTDEQWHYYINKLHRR